MRHHLAKLTHLTPRWIEAKNYEAGITGKAQLLKSLEGDNSAAVTEMETSITRIQGLVF